MDAAASSAVSARRASPDASRTRASRAPGSEGRGAGESAGVGDGAVHQHPELFICQRLERQQEGARQKRRDHRERRVLGRRGDEHDPAVLDAGQQRVLLRLREAVDLVEEEDRGLAVEVALRQRLLHDLAHVPHARGDRRQLDEPASRGARDRLGEGRLSGAGRTPQDDRGRRGRGIRIREGHERRSAAQKVRLARDLVERRRPHPHRERRLPLEERGRRPALPEAPRDAPAARGKGWGKSLPQASRGPRHRACAVWPPSHGA